MGGYYLMQRGWQDHEVYGREKFSTRDAMCWLIENAEFRTVGMASPNPRARKQTPTP